MEGSEMNLEKDVDGRFPADAVHLEVVTDHSPQKVEHSFGSSRRDCVLSNLGGGRLVHRSRRIRVGHERGEEGHQELL